MTLDRLAIDPVPVSEETRAILKEDVKRVLEQGLSFNANVMHYYIHLLERDVPSPAANGRTVFILPTLAYLDAVKPTVSKKAYLERMRAGIHYGGVAKLQRADLVIMPCHYKEVGKDERWRLLIFDMSNQKVLLVDSDVQCFKEEDKKDAMTVAQKFVSALTNVQSQAPASRKMVTKFELVLV